MGDRLTKAINQNEFSIDSADKNGKMYLLWLIL